MANKNKNHRSGGKMGGRHTTLIDAAEPIVDMVQKRPEVKKIVAGFIVQGRSGGQRRIKLKEMDGVLQLSIRGNSSLQDVWVYSDNIEETKKFLEE